MALSVETVVVAVLFALRAGALTSFPEDFHEVLPLPRWWSGSQPTWGAGPRPGPGPGAEQLVYLPALLPREAHSAGGTLADVDVPISYSFDAFGRSFDLQLMPNRRLVSPQFRVWSERGQEGALSAVDASCHFLHAGPGAVAAFSACKDHKIHGLIVTDNSTYEVLPLLTPVARADFSGVRHGRSPYVIRRASPPPPIKDDARPLRFTARRPRIYPQRRNPSSYTVEVALFLDEAAYKTFYPHFNYNEAELRDMLLGYINGVQALYQHPSLGTRIQLSLVRLTLLRSQPAELPAHAERGPLLDAFCAYQRSLNVDDDDDPQHWDMALMLSGLDLFAMESGVRNTVTMGLAPVGGVCLPAHSCVISEFGSVDDTTRPYPSTGFTSVYILAHEIGHNLGMHHDGTGNSCAREGYIMSPSRGTNGEATWSPCSARVVADLQWATCLFDGGDDLDAPNELHHERYGNAPGVTWGAKKQCEILLLDRDASPAEDVAGDAGGVCARLTCRSPHRAGLYHAGPALPGTVCGPHKWCQGGECVGAEPSPDVESPSGGSGSGGISGAGGTSGAGGMGGSWTDWTSSACRSGCTFKSKGAIERRRTCPPNAVCEGSSYDVVLCDDTKVCGKKKRVTPNDFASRKCTEFASKLSVLDPRGGGLQVPHDPSRLWMGCAVFCRRAGGGGFYAPRVELHGAGFDPYFPDGTWCHREGDTHYYCLQHHCLPENFKFSPQWHIWEVAGQGQDIEGALNARARPSPALAGALRSYLSLDDAGAPLARSAFPPRIPDEPEANWEVLDYVDLPRNNTS